MKTEGNDSPVQMAHTRLSEGITLIFDQDTMSNSASPPSRSRSRSSHHSGSHSSGSSRRAQRREVRRERHRSSSSTSSSSSSGGGGSSRKHPRSRSHPRCHRASSRSRCCRQHRHRHGRRSPPRRYRARSRSYSPSPSPSPDKSSRRRGHRSRSGSVSQRRVRRGVAGRCRTPRSPSRIHETYRSRSRTSGRSVVSQSRDEKRELLRTAKAGATRALRADQLELPECEKPILEELPVKRRPATPEPQSESEQWVRPEPVPQKSPTQQDDVMEPEDAPNPKTSPKRKTISFTIQNSVAKPTSVFVPSTSAESYVTARAESFTSSRRPYGHWVPVRKVAQTSLSHTSSKRSLTTSR